MSKLSLVPTPIGNLKDITLRAIETLKTVDLVLAEDTRKSGLLLKHLQIKKPMRSYHAHNEHGTLVSLLTDLKKGTTMALISDAGTPGISDPGYLLVRTCIEQNIPVECLPGPTALIPALAISGIPSDRFTFEGFLPAKKGRESRLKLLKELIQTFILYESPHRLIRTLNDLSKHLGDDRHVSISREISKMHEETIRGTLNEAVKHFSKGKLKGEFVIVVAGRAKS